MRIIILIFSVVFFTPVGVFGQELLVQQAQKKIRLTGYTRGNQTVTVTSEVSGKVIAVNYDVGQTVEAQPFFEIDPTFIDFEIESAKHSIAKLDVSLAKMDASIIYLKKEYIRYDILHKGDRATEVQRDNAANRLEQAELDRDATKVDKELLNTHLKELMERKARHNIYAPKGWQVVRRNVEVGEIINMNTPLARVSNYRKLVVPLSVAAEEYEALKMLPAIFPAHLEGKVVNARLNWVNPEFNEETRKLGIELALETYQGEKRGGLRFTLPLTIKAEGLLVPKSAVSNRYENPKVTLLKTGETVKVIILGENNGNILIADNPRLAVGQALQAE